MCDKDYITEHFNLSELVHSNTAKKRGINNDPPLWVEKNLREACEKLWEPAREILGHPMKISSGYRSEALNKAIGGSMTSAHTYGLAIDFTSPYGSTTEVVKLLAKELKAKGIPWDQMILEYPNSPNGGWVHLGYKSRDGKQRGQTLVINKGTGYVHKDFTRL